MRENGEVVIIVPAFSGNVAAESPLALPFPLLPPSPPLGRIVAHVPVANLAHGQRIDGVSKHRLIALIITKSDQSEIKK